MLQGCLELGVSVGSGMKASCMIPCSNDTWLGPSYQKCLVSGPKVKNTLAGLCHGKMKPWL